LERTPKNDTVTYWIKDKDVMAMDTLLLRVTYMKTDTLNQAVPVTDTLTFVDRARRNALKEEEKKEKELEKKRKKGEEEKPETKFLNITTNIAATWDTYKNISLLFDQPFVDTLDNKIKLQQMKDSVFSDIPFRLEPDSANPRLYTIRNKWGYGMEYRIQIDSASIHGIDGLWNDKIDSKFKVKTEDQYGQLAIRVAGTDSVPAFMELLNSSDKPVRRAKVIDNISVFRDLDPGTYYVRITLDANNNGMWDTGNYDKHLQPEMVYYSPKEYKIAAYAEIFDDEAWVLDPSTLANQKPLVITKQKPQEKDSKRKQLEEKEAKENSGKNRNSNSNTNSASTTGNQRNTGNQMMNRGF
jgi:hypothetical protein